VSNPGSYEDVVGLLVTELQRRGIYWMDYPVVGGTFRENLQGTPGNSHLDCTHPGAKHAKRNQVHALPTQQRPKKRARTS
jgi:hypothetical protein